MSQSLGAAQRKALGAFYTYVALVRFLVDWGFRKNDKCARRDGPALVVYGPVLKLACATGVSCPDRP